MVTGWGVGGVGCVRCSERERHERAHRLWRHASEQGNTQAALLIGDAHFYGRGGGGRGAGWCGWPWSDPEP